MFPLWVPDISPPGRNSGPEQNRDREKQLCKTYAPGEGRHVMIFLGSPWRGDLGEIPNLAHRHSAQSQEKEN